MTLGEGKLDMLLERVFKKIRVERLRHRGFINVLRRRKGAA
jgi:hypothetical protein